MWAWPIAVISCVRVPLRRASSAGEDRAVARVAEAVELAQQLAAPRALLLVHQRREHAEVARERPRVRVEARDLAALEPERRRDRLPAAATAGSARPSRTARCRRSPPAPAAPRRPPRSATSVAAEPVPPRAAHQPLRRLAVEPQRRLRVRDQQEVDLRARPRLRHGRPRRPATTSPTAARAPCRAPRPARPPSGPVIRSREHARVSGCTSVAASRAAWRTRSRV